MPGNVLVLQHAACETPGIIADVLRTRVISARYIRSFAGDPIPDAMADADGLIVMGGPMGVYEHPGYPFLRDEMRLIESALASEKPVLGVCLGSQMLAHVLGAPVAPGPEKEIGWHLVTLREPTAGDRLWRGMQCSFVAYHWHGDVFTLPQDAVRLASSRLTEVQAFRYGNLAYGFLFHLEVTGQMIDDMVATFSGDLQDGEAEAILHGVPTYLPRLHTIGETVIGRWSDLIDRGTP